jgi:type IV pilus assembly protein PilE
MTSRKSNRGFSLIELMVVVVIVGVLTMVAYPAYQGFTVKANRAEAKAYLMHLAQKQQLYFNDSRTYAADEDALKVPNNDESERNLVAENYAVAFDLTTTSPVPVFTITATPLPKPPQKDDGVLSIDNTGEKLHAGKPW